MSSSADCCFNLNYASSNLVSILSCWSSCKTKFFLFVRPKYEFIAKRKDMIDVKYSSQHPYSPVQIKFYTKYTYYKQLQNKSPYLIQIHTTSQGDESTNQCSSKTQQMWRQEQTNALQKLNLPLSPNPEPRFLSQDCSCQAATARLAKLL